jgi:inhibitor of cysteine peptidase
MRLLLLFVTLLLVACAATKSSTPEQTVVLTKQDKDKVQNVTVGESFVITLDENPTTGYVWAVEGQPELLVLQSSDYVSDVHPNQSGAPMIVGAGGKRSFTFMAQKSGTTTLKLKHWRSWEGDSSIVDTFSVPVVVR